ncbi:helix-turn-helix domain-containing protein [Pseudomonas phenolilytica]|uniref:helix-turn-helix domain-containing protein n=1 Tax=Pseudomonas phenolilytica TaxID=2746321 RepID=UPI001F45D498|nr:helix-turn-helix domain-containing protein [Pseudomonas phenolilytica]UIP88444.1 helix-turn-helix domain-containing protein [Pseudomonas phenolilytica]
MPAHSAIEQDRRLLEALRIRPVTTIEAANDLDIVHPPSTVRRLRRRGFDIRTQWAYQATEPGRPPHRVGQYVLMQEAAA